jgi:hydrogenase maturation protein HypF
VKEPRRSAMGVLFEIFGPNLAEAGPNPALAAFDPAERRLIERMLGRGINSPLTSSVGRLFDAVASLSGFRQAVRHEGQAAMELEFAAELADTAVKYPSPLCHGPDVAVLDWEPMVREILSDARQGTMPPQIAARFQNTLVEWIVAVARLAGQERVVLSGGCFQNVFLAEEAAKRLAEEGFRPFLHQRIPPNDGGIALGQIVAANRAAGDGT